MKCRIAIVSGLVLGLLLGQGCKKDDKLAVSPQEAAVAEHDQAREAVLAADGRTREATVSANSEASAANSQGPVPPTPSAAEAAEAPRVDVGESVEPEEALRLFLVAMLSRNRSAIERLTIPHPESQMLLEGKPVPQEAMPKQLEHLRAVPIERLKVGDTVRLPNGGTLVLDATDINEDSVHLTIPENPVPFVVIRHEGRWRIFPVHLIAARKAAAEADARLTGKRKGYSSVPVWDADPEQAEQLGEEIELGEYRIRPPEGFTLPQGAGNFNICIWERSGEGKSAARLMLFTTTPPEPFVFTLERGLDDGLSSIRKRYDEWQVTPAERGQIDGLLAVRAHWHGIAKTSTRLVPQGQSVHGFSYVIFEGKKLVMIISLDVAPSHEISLKLTEAAALTLRKPR